MARSISNARLFASLLNRRSFAAAAASESNVSAAFAKDGHGGSRAEKDHMHDGVKVDEESSEIGISSPWTLDPVTGYHTPCHGRVATATNNASSNEIIFNHTNISTSNSQLARQ